MKNWLICIGAFLVFLSCNHELKKPDDLIPEKKMKAIIKDIYLYKQVRNYRLAPNLPIPPKTNLALLKKHGVTLEQFQDSYQYYIIDNAAYDEFLEEIRLELEAELPEEERINVQKNSDRLRPSPQVQ